jgi:hypothetical protein
MATKREARRARRSARKSARQQRRATRQGVRQERRAARQGARSERRTLRKRVRQAKRFDRNLKRQAEKLGVKPEDLALELTKKEEYSKNLASYVDKGQNDNDFEDMQNPEYAAAAAYDIMGEDMADDANADENAINEDWEEYDMEEQPEKGDFFDYFEGVLEEEEEEASFNGSDYFLTPETAALAIRAGKAGADKYREIRFSKGKPAFGKTKEQYEAAQKRKAEREASGEAQTGTFASEAQEVLGAAGKAAAAERVRQNRDLFLFFGGLLVIVLFLFRGNK